MQVCSFIINSSGHETFGLVCEHGVIDAGKLLEYRDLKHLLESDGLSALQSLSTDVADYAFHEINFLPVIKTPNKILCVGMNYSEKRIEFGETNPAPTLFIRFADSLTAHLQPIQKPVSSEQFDYEGELAVVIGKPAHQVAEQEALDYVAGYSCFMDATVRDMQFTWFTAGKNWPATGGFGPWMTTCDEIPDPQQLELKTFLNGVQVQKDSTQNMVHSVAAIIAYVTHFTPLSPGDVIITGSPGGVGKSRTPQLFMFPGDDVAVEISHIGRLSHIIR
ncbi:fumarylacetoacetate hydrolase family protein [Rosenbergiella australiborealis]|uniref:Fumarylacetoacetate hydrolase family protein n=1 Tax=Rosenbergiella australiborealis TaxID=1544696 RepID=A0ABS5T6Z0_9GAMM|nr:fumarylacetoacetate hydrolase family protein [Rosenbergiella australiborealis]MBT0727488.1 fumarylacetoacetate hydrolase family protein [Rosenbergiella australiborealis]